MDIRDLLTKTAEKFADKSAIIFQDQVISFAELNHHVLQLAVYLQSKGIKSGDKIAFYLPNSPEYVYSYLASFYLGAVGVPLDYMLKEDELTSCLNHSESKLLIAKRRKGVDLDLVLNKVKPLEKVLYIDSDEKNESIENVFVDGSSNLDQIAIKESDPALIMYTSGTTGKPKGILLNYQHLSGSPAAMNYFVDLSDQDVKLAAIPLSHIGGFIYIQNCINFGIPLVLMERFNPHEFLALIEKYKVTCFHIVPPMYNAILTLKQIDNFDLSSLRWVVVFGAPSSPEIMERFHQYCPNAKLLNGWGMTETCPPNTVTPLDSDNIASVGKPAPHCTIKIFDENDHELPVGNVGEIVIKGWVVMNQYYKDPEETNRVIRNNWLYTGDLGKFDKEGFLYIVGRKKEMIKVGGQIVFEPEIEAAFYKHEDVVEVAAIGIPDEMKGESIKVFIVLNDQSRMNENDLKYFAREHLANFKVPKSIEICKELPKNRTGKIDKSKLKQGLSLSGKEIS